MNYENLQENTQKGMARMLGQTFVEVTGSVGDGEMVFVTEDGQRFIFAHWQNCCESVDINDIVGDLQDLVGEPLLVAVKFGEPHLSQTQTKSIMKAIPIPSTSSPPARAMWMCVGWESLMATTQKMCICSYIRTGRV